MPWGSNKQQVSFGEQFWIDRTVLTGGSVSGNTVTGLSGLTAGKYNGCRMTVLSGTNKGKIYHVTSNTTSVLTFQEAATGFAATDAVTFECKLIPPTIRNLWIDVPEDFDFPTADRDLNEVYGHGGGQDRVLAATNKISYERSIPLILQNWRFAFMLFGIVADTGTADAVGSTTMDGATYVGEINLKVHAGTNFANAAVVQIGSGATAEVRAIASGGTTVNLVLTYPLRFAHSDAEAVITVVAPFTHTITANPTVPYFDLVGVMLEATAHVRDALGCKIVSGELSSSTDDLVRFTADIAPSDVKVSGTSPLGTTPSVTVVTTDPYHYRMVSGGLTLNSIVYQAIEAFSYKLDRGITPVYAHQDVSTNKPYLQVEGRRKHELTFTVIPFNSNIYDLIDAGTVFDASIHFVRTANTDEFTITWHNVTGTTAPHGMPMDGPVKVSAVFNPASVTSVVVIDSIPFYPCG